MIAAIRYAREHKIPLFGICLGMQMMVVEYARHVCGMEDAHSSELNPATTHPVIDLMPDQVGVTDKGGTMRLGSCPCVLQPDTLARSIYGSEHIDERHRHRYELNNDYRDALTGAGPPPGRPVAGRPSGGDGGTTGTIPGSWGPSSTRN